MTDDLAPTTGDAIRRRLVTYPTRHGGRGIGRLIYVDRGGKAKVRLPSGAHVTTRTEHVRLVPQPPAGALGPTP